MILWLLLSFNLWAQADTSGCSVDVYLPGAFRAEHMPRFRGHGFSVNTSGPFDVKVQGEYATGNIRLGRLIVYRIYRGEQVEVGRVNARFLNGLPSQMIARALPMIQNACALSLLEDSRDLCPMTIPHLQEEKNFIQSAQRCNIFDLANRVDSQCRSEGFTFCMTESREYTREEGALSIFDGTDCRVEVRGRKYYSMEETGLMRCKALSECQREILTRSHLNTEHRRSMIQRTLEFHRCESAPLNDSIQVNQSERSMSREKASPSSTQNIPTAISQ